MIEFQTPLSITSQFSFCGLPFRLDTYAGCSFNCTYCFARLRGGYIHSKKLRAASSTKIITKFENAINKPKITTGLVPEFIRKRMPVHFGGMSDPFQPAEIELKTSLKVLKYLCSINYPIIISTRSLILSSEPYLGILKSNPNILVQYSFSTTENQKARIVEPFANKPSDLMNSIEILSREGIKTSIRWQPFIPGLSEEPSTFIKRISGIGVKHIGFEHLKLPVENNNPLWRRLNENLGFNIKEYYKNVGSKYDGRELVLNSEVKLDTIINIKSILKNYNITFGAADNEHQYLSDTYCCCSGADQFTEFQEWNKFQIAHAVKKSNGQKITYNIINNEWQPKGSIDKYLNSESRIRNNNRTHNTITDYVKKRWNDLSSSFNPTSFHGVVYKGELDSKGMKIYEWDKSVIVTLTKSC